MLQAAADAPARRFMWITPDRVLYVGLIGAPSMRTMGSVNVYVAQQGAIRVRVEGGDWHKTELAVLPPLLPAQLHVHGPLPLTLLAVPTLHNPLVGALLKLCPLALPHTPLMGGMLFTVWVRLPVLVG